jgi:hypothetical protein
MPRRCRRRTRASFFQDHFIDVGAEICGRFDRIRLPVSQSESLID